MHRKKEYIVECADPDCRNRVKTTSHRKIKLCPQCARIRRAGYQKRVRERTKETKENQSEQYDPDIALHNKLCSCEYCIQYDAAPEEESFPKGAKITGQELNLLLKHEYIYPGSLIRHRKTQRVHEVARSEVTGKLYLKPIPYPPRL